MQKIIVRPIAIKKLDNLANSWNNDDYSAIIDLLDGDTDGLSDAELVDYCYMTIADAEPDDSISVVLKYALGDKINEGQLENLVHDMTEDKMWEEYPAMNCHFDIFKANQLLYKAFNGKVPKGDAIAITLEVKTHNAEIKTLIQAQDPDCLLRLIMSGSSDHAVLHRLFDDEAKEGYLDDAKDILWLTDVNKKSEDLFEIVMTSSAYWFHDFIEKDEYHCAINLDLYDSKEE